MGIKTLLVPQYEIFDTLDLLDETIPVVVVVVVHPPCLDYALDMGVTAS